MPGELQPLAQNFAIVDADGKPNQYFIRWAQQRQIDITAGITIEQAQQLIDDWAAQRDIIAGIGLTGGGSLSADVTIDADTQAILDVISTTQGAILYRSATGWAALAPGTAGLLLQTAGPGADPLWGGSGASIARFAGFATTTPLSSEVLLDFQADINFTLAANLAGSKAGCSTNPAAIFVLDVLRNNIVIGNISISTAGVATLTTIGGTSKAIAIGDYVTVQAPAVADTSLMRLRFTLQGTL